MDFQALAKRCYEYHMNPTFRLKVPLKKYFAESPDEEINKQIAEYLQAMQSYLERFRVEKRSFRCQAELLDDTMAKVTQIKKKVAMFGYQNKDGKFLEAQHVLFLSETNKLELKKNGIPLSIQDIYQNLLSNPSFDLLKYVAMRKILLIGYKIYKSQEPHDETSETNVIPAKKRKLDASEKFADIFEKIRLNGPKQYEDSVYEPQPENMYQLRNNKPIELVSCSAQYFSEIPSIGPPNRVYALGPDYFIGFYQLIHVNLPANT